MGLHSFRLSEKRIVLKASKKDAEVAASSGELALAGKGFNADVEAEFKRNHREIDFSWIDRMQAIKIRRKKSAPSSGKGTWPPSREVANEKATLRDCIGVSPCGPGPAGRGCATFDQVAENGTSSPNRRDS